MIKMLKVQNICWRNYPKKLNDENLNQVQDSKTISGVYVFGDDFGKIPLRIPFFNNMYLKMLMLKKVI